MNRVLVASHWLLWVAVLMQSILILSLMRQVGSLLLRVGSLRPLDAGYGPPIGHEAPWLPPSFRVPSEDDKTLLLVFVSTTCSDCAALAHPLNAVAASYSQVSVVTVSADDESELAAWAQRNRLRVAVVSAPDAVEAYEIGGTPYAFVVSPDGTIRARGGVNHIEHVEALLRQCQIPPDDPQGPQAAQLELASVKGEPHE